MNLDELIDSAKENEVFLEINSFPDRLDLNDTNIRFAKDKGIMFSIGTDTHNVGHLGFMRYGVSTARRGWLEKKDVINTMPTSKLKKLLAH